MDQDTDVERLRRQSLWLSRFTLILFVATVFLIVVAHIMGFAGVAEKGQDFRPVVWRAIVLWSPAICYCYALWAIRRGFEEFARGGLFGPAIAAGCTRAGVALAVGGTLSAVGVPNLLRIMHDAGMVEAPPTMFRGVLHFDLAYLAVGVVGLALILLGRLMRRAAEIQNEAAALRDELSEFF